MITKYRIKVQNYLTQLFFETRIRLKRSGKTTDYKTENFKWTEYNRNLTMWLKIHPIRKL